MVIFDQNAVTQCSSVVDPTAEKNGPLLKRAPAGKRFPGIHDTGRVAAHGPAEPLRQSGDSGQVLKKVQGDPLGLQDGPPITFDMEEVLLHVWLGRRRL